MGTSLSRKSHLLSDPEPDPPASFFSFDAFYQLFLSSSLPSFHPLDRSLSPVLSRGFIDKPSKRLVLQQHIKIKGQKGFLGLYQYLKVLEFLRDSGKGKMGFKYLGVSQLEAETESNNNWEFGVLFEGFAMATLDHVVERGRKSDLKVGKQLMMPVYGVIEEILAAGLHLGHLRIRKRDLLFAEREEEIGVELRMLGFEVDEDLREDEEIFRDLEEITREISGDCCGENKKTVELGGNLSNKKSSCCGKEEIIVEMGGNVTKIKISGYNNNSDSNYSEIKINTMKNSMDWGKVDYEQDLFEYFPEKNDFGKLRVYLDLFEEENRVLPALRFLEEILPRLKRFTSSLQEEVYFLNRYTLILRRTGQLIKSQEYMEIVMEMASKAIDKSSKDYAYLLNNLGLVMSDLGQTEKAMSFLTNSEILLKNEQKSLKTLKVMTNLSEILWKSGDIERSFKIQLEILNLKRHFFPNDLESIAISLNNFALSWNDYGDPKMANKILSELRMIIVKTPELSTETRATCYNTIGYIYAHMQNWEKSQDAFETSLKELKKCTMKPDRRMFGVMKNLAGLYIRKGFKEGIEMLDAAWEIARNEGFGEEVKDEILEMKSGFMGNN